VKASSALPLTSVPRAPSTPPSLSLHGSSSPPANGNLLAPNGSHPGPSKGFFSFADVKVAMEKWKNYISTNEEIFRNFYQFVFEYLKQHKTTNIDKHEALIAWKIVGIDKRWGIFEKWEKFWEENPAKVVTKDTWYMLVRFIEKMGTNVENYDENDSWPLMLDEFVKEVMKKEC